MGTVLVVDDEEALLDVIADVVSDLGYVPVSAHDGAEGLARAREHRPDLILSDHMMPRLTGMDLLREVRDDPKLREVPFILMSAAHPDGAERATRFLRKPVDLDTLQGAIRGLLDHKPASTNGTPAPVAAATVPAGQAPGPRRDLLLWIAHEVRTPLAAARLNAEVLARQVDGADPQSGARARVLVTQLTMLNETLASLIDIAELADAGRSPALHDEDLARLVCDVVREWRARVPGAQLNLPGAMRPVVFQMDAERVKRVASMLVATALRHAGTAAAIDVDVEARGDDGVLVMTCENDLPPQLMNGPLDPDRLVRSGVEDISILPLYLAAVVARAHHGTVSVTPESGHRATVTLQLPRR